MTSRRASAAPAPPPAPEPVEPLPEPVAASPGKPAYRIPSMREIEALAPNGLTVASTFSGCGGSCLGLRMAGFRVAWSNEFIEEARRTYRANHPSAYLDERDIRTIKPEEILARLGLRKGELDVFEGSPPCSSFSMAGNREAGWGKSKSYSDKEQRTDDLFAEWVRLLGGLLPRAFVAENVSGMVIGSAKGHFLEAISSMRALGYRVGAKLLDAQWLGVPQARRRVIFVGVREDVGAEPPFPRPLPYRYSVRDALPWLGTPESEARVVHDTSGVWGSGDVTDRPSPTITVGKGSISAWHFKVYGVPAPTEEEIRAVNFERYAIGKEWKKLRPGEGSDRYLNLSRPHPDEPCPTVTATAGSSPGTAGVTHPLEPRKFTIPELRRICGFPDDFVLTGSYRQQWERLGRSVPPPMMAAVGRALAATLLASAKKGRR